MSMLILAARIAGGALLILLALFLTAAGAGGAAAFLGAVATAIAVNVSPADGFAAFWGIEQETFFLFLTICVGGLLLSLAGLELLGGLLGGVSLAFFGLALTGVLHTQIGQAAFLILARISLLPFLPIALFALFLFLLLGGI